MGEEESGATFRRKVGLYGSFRRLRGKRQDQSHDGMQTGSMEKSENRIPLQRHAGMTSNKLLKGAFMDKKKIILLVEDNPDDVDLTVRAFEKNKSLKVLNELVVVRDGQEALDCLVGAGKYAGAATTPSVVLLDLKLPKVGGLEVLRRIRENERTRLIPVVILTSSREEQDLLKGYSLGANSFIRKPVDFDKFLEAVHQLGLYWLLLNEPPPVK